MDLKYRHEGVGKHISGKKSDYRESTSVLTATLDFALTIWSWKTVTVKEVTSPFVFQNMSYYKETPFSI